MSEPAPRFTPLDFKRKPLDQSLADIRAFQQAMSTRRSVRDFSTDPVPVELIERSIAIAASAPSGANQQPWRFVAVQDPAVKREIRIAAEAEEKENYERRFPDEWLKVLAPFGTDWRKPFLEDAPWLIVVFRVDYGIDEDEQKFKHYYVNESAGIATGFLLAALQVAGLVTLTHTPSPMGFLGRILKRPPNERPFLLIPTGFPAAGATVPNIEKRPLEKNLIFV